MTNATWTTTSTRNEMMLITSTFVAWFPTHRSQQSHDHHDGPATSTPPQDVRSPRSSPTHRTCHPNASPWHPDRRRSPRTTRATTAAPQAEAARCPGRHSNQDDLHPNGWCSSLWSSTQRTRTHVPTPDAERPPPRRERASPTQLHAFATVNVHAPQHARKREDNT